MSPRQIISRVRFRLDLADPATSLATDLRYPGAPVIVAFAGVVGKIGMPVFEFFNVTNGLEINRIFVRDLDCLWYQRGIRDLGDDGASAASVLRDVVDTVSPSRVVTVGNSGGGYAAMLFGSLIDADVVLAFSPQTVLGRVEAMKYRESTWLGVTERLHALGGPDERYADLRQMLLERPSGPTWHVYYAVGDEIDTLHAEHLRDVPQVKLFPQDHDDHNLILRLRNEGSLRGLLADSLQVANVPSAAHTAHKAYNAISPLVGVGVRVRTIVRRMSGYAASGAVAHEAAESVADAR